MQSIFSNSMRERIDSLYSFNKFPRRVGNPFALTVNNYKEYLSFINYHNGKRPLFTAFNFTVGHQILFENMLWDVDTDSSNGNVTVEDAQNDIRKLDEYFIDYDHLITFSGRKGFHFILKMEPTSMVANESLRYNIREFQNSIKKQLGLRCVNVKSSAPLRVVRIPGTRYVYRGQDNKFYALNRWCIPINSEVVNRPLEEVIALSEVGDISNLPIMKGKKYPTNEFTIQRNVTDFIGEASKDRGNGIFVDFLSLSEKDFDVIVKEMYDDSFREKIFGRHPSYETRLLGLLKFMEFQPRDKRGNFLDVHFNEQSAVTFLDRISRNWDDRDLIIQSKYIHYSYTRRYGNGEF